MAVSGTSLQNQNRIERKAIDLERESLEMDVVFVGAGPANLSGALHLTQLIEKAKSEGTDPADPNCRHRKGRVHRRAHLIRRG